MTPPKKPAALPFFGDAYLADTTHLSTEEHGAYFLLLLAAWRQPDAGLPLDDRKLARITGLSPRKWQSIKPTIMEFWTVDGGRMFQSRLRRERAWVDQKSEQNRQAAEARWNAQDTENKQPDPSERISERNAPPPPPPPHSGSVEDKSSTAADAAKVVPAPATAIDVTKALFDTGIAMLGSIGVREGQARSIIGKWRKDYRDGEVLAVLAQAQAQPDISHPVEWITAALRNERKRSTTAGVPNNGQPQRPERASVSEIGQRIASRAAGHG